MPLQSHGSPLVSVIMPCWNGSNTIASAIRSIQEQTFADWELLVADDGSNDGSRTIVKKLSTVDQRIKLVSHGEGRSGAAAARNRALQASTGRYIAFLDVDDQWLPEKLAVQICAMEEHSSSFSCTGYWVKRRGKLDILRTPPPFITREILLRGNRIGCLTAIYDSQILGKQAMPDIPLRQDYALWCRLLTLTDSALGISQPLAIHHRTSKSLSSNSFLASIATWQMFRKEAGLNRRKATLSLCSHLLGRFFRG